MQNGARDFIYTYIYVQSQLQWKFSACNAHELICCLCVKKKHDKLTCE